MLKKIHHTFIISEAHINERLDQALVKLLPEYSRTQIQEWIETGAVLVNQLPTKAKRRLKGCEIVEVRAALANRTEEWQAQNIPLHIIFEDETLLIVDKPAHLVMHPGAGHQDQTLLNALLHHLPELQTLPRAGILHRLDKDTSGLLVVAKTSDALKKLSMQLKKRELLREYQAIVYGRLISGNRIDAPIGRHPLQRKRMAVIETAKKAVTHYRVVEKYKAHTRLKIRLETGRTHQIRVHMQYIHHPIVGDVTYGGRVQLSKGMSPNLIQTLRQFKRQALHAFALGLHHPITQEFMRWEIELPEDMQQLIHELRKDVTG